MDLLHEHQKSVQAYLDRALSLQELEDRVADLAASVAEEGAGAAGHLSAGVWRLISEYGYGHRDEESVRSELARLLAIPHVSRTGWGEAARSEAHSISVRIFPRFEAPVPQFGPQTIPMTRFPELV